jgi:hypothetical protein
MKTQKSQLKDIKEKMTLKNFLNPTTLISDIKALSKALKQKTGTTQGPAGKGLKRAKKPAKKRG